MSDTTHDEAHTGPIRTPGQLLLAVFFSFVIPIFGVIALVYYVVSENKPAGDTKAEHYALGGLSKEDRDRGVMARIQKIGAVEIRDANRPLKSGEEVFKAQCTTCHSNGAAGSPYCAYTWRPPPNQQATPNVKASETPDTLTLQVYQE